MRVLATTVLVFVSYLYDRSVHGMVLSALFLASCASAGSSTLAEPGPKDANTNTETTQAVVPNTDLVEPVRLEDPCAAFDHRQKNALSREEHERQYGCPPCPCVCDNGEIVCAPCMACEAFGEPADESLRAVEPQRKPKQ